MVKQLTFDETDSVFRGSVVSFGLLVARGRSLRCGPEDLHRNFAGGVNQSRQMSEKGFKSRISCQEFVSQVDENVTDGRETLEFLECEEEGKDIHDKCAAAGGGNDRKDDCNVADPIG